MSVELFLDYLSFLVCKFVFHGVPAPFHTYFWMLAIDPDFCALLCCAQNLDPWLTVFIKNKDANRTSRFALHFMMQHG